MNMGNSVTRYIEVTRHVIFYRDASLLDSFHCNNVMELNQSTWIMYTNQ